MFVFYFRLQCKVLEVIAPAHHNGMANGHSSSADDGDTIVISDSDDSETHNSSAQNGYMILLLYVILTGWK